jgi:hypothetical protein
MTIAEYVICVGVLLAGFVIGWYGNQILTKREGSNAKD